MNLFALRRFFLFLCLAVGLTVFGVSYVSFGGPAAGPALYGCSVDWWCPPATCFPIKIDENCHAPNCSGDSECFYEKYQCSFGTITCKRGCKDPCPPQGN